MELAIGLLSLCFVALMYLLTDKVLVRLKELTELCKKINNQTESEAVEAFKKSRTDAMTYGMHVPGPTTAGFMAYQVDPIKQEVTKSVEENYYPNRTVEFPTEFEKLGQAIAKGMMTEEPIIESEAIKRFNSMTDNGKRVKRGQSRTIQELRSIIANILKDKKERMNTSAALFKKYGMNKTTFYKYATKEQAEEMMALQKQLAKERMGQPRLRG